MREIRRAQQRPLTNREADVAAVRAVAQAAVNVELFTIPLYMVTLYSIQGTHHCGRDWQRPRIRKPPTDIPESLLAELAKAKAVRVAQSGDLPTVGKSPDWATP